MRPFASGALASVLLLAGLSGPTHARSSAPRQVLVVAINLTEMEARDASETSDVRRFVRRLATRVPHPPDIVLVQEVRLRSAKTTAAALSRRFGKRFVVGVPPARDPMWQERRRDGSVLEFTQPNAVIFNASAMKMISRPRFVKTTYDAGGLRFVRRHPYATLREVASRLKVSVASVHLYMPKKITARKRAYHARKVAVAVEREAGRTGAGFRVLGGDFNSPMSVDGTRTPFYRTLVSWRDYTDTIGIHGVDYIFAKGRDLVVAAGGVDRRDKAYSDHAFRWSLFGRG